MCHSDMLSQNVPKNPLPKPINIPYLWLDCNSQEQREIDRWDDGFINVSQSLHMVETKIYENMFWYCKIWCIYNIQTTTTYTAEGDLYLFAIEDKQLVREDKNVARHQLFLDGQSPSFKLSSCHCIDESIEYYPSNNFFVNDHRLNP